MKRLSFNTLGLLPGSVARPQYDPSVVDCGILHLGVGNFHRAHQAVATENVLAAGDLRWGIAGVSLRRPDQRDALMPQDALYSLTMRGSTATERRIVGALRHVLVLGEQYERILRLFADPRIRVISLTVTEKGYSADMQTGALRRDDPDVRADLEFAANPRSTIGLLAFGLAHRADAGAGSVTVVSCDNLSQNGDIVHRALTEFIGSTRPELGGWIDANVTFPNTMVDRITPATTHDLRQETRHALGLDDAAPVETEVFSQWVIEDRFANDRPDWSLGGAEFVGSVEPYERMKLRLLNGAHTALAATGLLAGHRTVAEAMDDPAISGLIGRIWHQSAATLPGDVDVPTYTSRLAARFRNRQLAHGLAQIASDGAQKLPQRILAPLRELRAASRPHHALSFAVAAWVRSCQGRDDGGARFEIADPAIDALPRDPDAPAIDVVSRWVRHTPVFGDLAMDGTLAVELTGHYEAIATRGVHAAALELLDQERMG